MAKPKILRRVTDHFGDKYAILDILGEGHTGIVYKASREKDPDNKVAIKMYFPTQPMLWIDTQLRKKLESIDPYLFKKEVEFLKQVQHPGIQEIRSWGDISFEDASRYFKDKIDKTAIKEQPVQFLVSKFINGLSYNSWLKKLIESAKEKNKHLQGIIKPQNARHLLIKVITEISMTLDYIHSNYEYQHSDLRENNILIDENTNVPILIDFGFAHCFDLETTGDDQKFTQIRLILETWPEQPIKEIRSLVTKNDSNKVKRETLKEIVFPGIDLFHLGLLIQETIKEKNIDYILNNYDIDYLTLLSGRLTTWDTVKKSSASEYVAQLLKLSSGYWDSAGIDEKKDTKRIALPKSSLWVDKQCEKIFETHAFRRLQLLNQLSFLNLVYPGASQTRFEHSLSVYVTANNLIKSLIRSPRFSLLFVSGTKNSYKMD